MSSVRASTSARCPHQVRGRAEIDEAQIEPVAGAKPGDGIVRGVEHRLHDHGILAGAQADRIAAAGIDEIIPAADADGIGPAVVVPGIDDVIAVASGDAVVETAAVAASNYISAIAGGDAVAAGAVGAARDGVAAVPRLDVHSRIGGGTHSDSVPTVADSERDLS